MGKTVGKVRKLNGRRRKEQLKQARCARMKKLNERKERPAVDVAADVEGEEEATAPPPAKAPRTEEEKRSKSSGAAEISGDRGAATCSNTSPTVSGDTPPSLPSLCQFSVDRVLSEDVATKTITVAGHFPCNENPQTDPSPTAVVIAEKTPLSHSDLLESVFNTDTKFCTSTSNNVYSQVAAECGDRVGDLKLLTVFPATEAHLRKYSRQLRHVVHETPQDYETVTRPFIESQSFNIQWVYNILEGREEQDRIILRDPDPETGFVLLPDFKWDQKDLQNLYLLAICNQRNICSLRDLRSHHLPLLRNMLVKGQEAIYKKYGIPGDQLRVYVHYQPSYYHLHVHFTQLSYTAPKTCVGEAHLLHDVISNIETFDPDYYQKCTLSFTVSESCLLWKAFQDQPSNQDGN